MLLCRSCKQRHRLFSLLGMPYSYDPVVAALARVVDVMWPQVFDAVASTGPMADVEPIAHLFRERQQNPDYAYAAVAISRDPRLAPLLGPNGAGTFIRFDDGFGFRIQEAAQVPEELVRAAARIAAAQDAAETTRSLIDTLRCLLPDVRRLVAGESVDVRVLTAFEGIGIESGRTVQTPWGIMRAPSPVRAATTSVRRRRDAVRDIGDDGSDPDAAG